MTLIEKLRSQKKVTRHWIHCIGVFVTLGMWLPFYVIILAFRAIHNRDIDSQINGAALAMAEMNAVQNIVNKIYTTGDTTAARIAAAQMRADFDDNLPFPR